MENVHTHQQAIDQISAELGLDREQVEKICNMTFGGRGMLQKMKQPNVIILPGIGKLMPDNRGVKAIRSTIAALERLRDADKHRAFYKRQRDKAKPQEEPQEHIFEDCHYMLRMQTFFMAEAKTFETNLNKVKNNLLKH